MTGHPIDRAGLDRVRAIPESGRPAFYRGTTFARQLAGRPLNDRRWRRACWEYGHGAAGAVAEVVLDGLVGTFAALAGLLCPKAAHIPTVAYLWFLGVLTVIGGAAGARSHQNMIRSVQQAIDSLTIDG